MTIYGECIGPQERTKVTISALVDEGCEIELQASSSLLDGLIDLWIGAIGPFKVMAENSGERRYHARFREPLDARIIAHFANA
jgi:hypothetical protein